MKAFFVTRRPLLALLIFGLGILAAVYGLDPAGLGRSLSAVDTGGPAVPVSVPGRISPLAMIEAAVRQKHPDVTHISPAEYDHLRGADDQDNVVLLDVREPNEFAVSHLAGARRVDPEASLESVLATAGDVAGKSIVFYCSVGARSAELAHRMQDRLRALGAASVANLSGGIFRWHNEERALVDAGGPTLLVHGYNGYWGQLIRRKWLISDQPQPAGAGGRAVKVPPESAS